MLSRRFSWLLVVVSILVFAVTPYAHAEGKGKSVSYKSAASAAAVSNPLDINSASAKELQVLPGIGPKIAERIVKYREEHGPFKSLDDLTKVKGIGEKKLEKIRPFLKIGSAKK